MTAVLANLLAIMTLAWGYLPAGIFADPGPCDSAARIGNRFIAGCRLGVWSGESEQLGLLIPCLAREDRPNRVRAFGERSFIASTACGLYRVELDGSTERLPFFSTPGALDSDHTGRAVVESGGEIWQLTAGSDDRWLVVRLDEEIPVQLQLAGEYLLVQGERRQLIHLGNGTRQELPGWGKLAVYAPGRQLTMHASGRYWISEAGSPEGEALRLPLGPGERVKEVVSLGFRALVLTSSRWFLVGDQTLSGRLPPVSDDFTPVRGPPGEPAPWMLAAGRVFRPERMVLPDGDPRLPLLGDLLAAAVDFQGLDLPPATPCYCAWLPRIGISVFGGQTRSLSLVSESDWTYSRARNLGLLVSLAWSLDSGPDCRADESRMQLQRAIRRERESLEERLAALLAALREHCRLGDRLAAEEADAHLRALTGLDVSCRME